MRKFKLPGIVLSRLLRDVATMRQCASVCGFLALTLGFLFAGPSPCAAAEAQAPGGYGNAKYGYFIAYPESFTPQGESDAGDGLVFLAPDGQSEMRVYAAYNVLNTPLRTRYEGSLDIVGKKPTYTLLRPDWYVVSGLSEGKIYYEKTLLRRDAYFTVSFTYDPATRELFDPLIGDILKSWKIQ
jgi:hypothetical protein